MAALQAALEGERERGRMLQQSLVGKETEVLEMRGLTHQLQERQRELLRSLERPKDAPSYEVFDEDAEVHNVPEEPEVVMSGKRYVRVSEDLAPSDRSAGPRDGGWRRPPPTRVESTVKLPHFRPRMDTEKWIDLCYQMVEENGWTNAHQDYLGRGLLSQTCFALGNTDETTEGRAFVELVRADAANLSLSERKGVLGADGRYRDGLFDFILHQVKLWFPLEDSKDVVSAFHERVWREHEDTPTSYGMELSRLASIAFKGDRPRALKECATKFRSNLPGAIKLKLQPWLPHGVRHLEVDYA